MLKRKPAASTQASSGLLKKKPAAASSAAGLKSKNKHWLEAAVLGGDAVGSIRQHRALWQQKKQQEGDLDGTEDAGFVVDKSPTEQPLFVFDTKGQRDDEDVEEEDRDVPRAKKTKAGKRVVKVVWPGVSEGRPPVWSDNDDYAVTIDIGAINRLRKLRASEDQSVVNGYEYQAKLRQQFAKLKSNQRWTAAFESARQQRLQDVGNSDSDDISIWLSRANKSVNKSVLLPQTSIDIGRVRDLNETARTDAVIESVKFHPNGQIAMTAGLDKTLHLFQVDGKVNEKIQSVHFNDMPIHSASFSPDGRTIFASGRRKFFYSYDVEAGAITHIPAIAGHTEKSLESMIVSPNGEFLAFMGSQGLVMLVSATNKHWVADLRMNGTVRSFVFSRDGKYLYTFGGDGDVYIWDVGQRKCLHKFHDDGSLHGTAITVSPDGSYIACGGDTGVVNLYSHRSVLQSATPKPEKTFMNLTTSINLLGFNNDGQILAMGSKQKRDAFKLAHVASRTVFANWPASNTPIHHASCFDFSPNNGYFTVANDRGRALLYRVKHYDTV